MAGINIASLASTATSPSTSNTATAVTSDPNITSTIAGNFNTFLQLLTTQLKNQNPLDPLDTNQFTQQLVQFASVEQQINMNTQLTTLVSMQKATQSTQAMSFLGATATVDGATAQLTGGKATWSFSSDKPATGTVTIKNATGSTVYTGTYPLNAGAQAFQWDGRGNNGALNARRRLHDVDHRQGRDRLQRGDLDRGARHGRQRRPHAEPPGALDRRAELHARQDQERGPPGAVAATGLFPSREGGEPSQTVSRGAPFTRHPRASARMPPSPRFAGRGKAASRQQ